MIETLESRLLLSISTTTVSSTELGTIGSYLDSGTTGIAGITPPSGWQTAGAAASLLHLANFDTTGGKVLLQADLSYHADAVSQFIDNNATFNFQPNWTINNQSSSNGTLQALDPNNFPNLDPQGAILRASSTLSLSTGLSTLVSNANSGTSKVTISPNPLTIPPGMTTLSQNNLLIGTPQTAKIANASDLNVISTTGLDFLLSGSSPSSFVLNVPGFTNNGGAIGGRRATVTATYTYVTPATISGEKFLDSNGNGIQDGGEPGLQGWEIDLTGTTAPIVDENNVVLLASQTVSFQVFTDASGNYTFNPNQTLTLTNGAVIPITGLLPGTYTISENNAFNHTNHPGISASSYVETLPGPNQNYSVTIGASGTATSGSLTGNNFGNFPIQPAARISITQLGNTTNEVGQPHTFQATVEYDDGLPANMFGGDGVTGFAPISGQTVTFTITDSNGATHTIVAGAINPTDANGHATFVFTSPTAGKVTGEASVTVNGLTVDTDPLTITPNSTDPTRPGVDGPVVKTFVDADIQLTPLTAVNEVGHVHTLTVSVEENDGNGSWFQAPAGTQATLTLTNSLGSTASFVSNGLSTLTVTLGAGGTAQVQINSATAGDVTINATTTLLVGGVSLTRSTGDGKGETGHIDGPAADKKYVDANISISPLTPVNEVTHSETFTITVNALPGGTGTPSFATPTVTFPGGAPGTVGAVTLVSINGNVGTWTVTINSAITGTFNVQASDMVTMGGVTVTRTTGDNLHNDGPSAVKNYVDANIHITPPNPVNEVGNAETFTITVNALPAATGTPTFATPTVTFPGGAPGTVGAVTLVSINGNVGTWTVTINSPISGTFNVQASDMVTMGGVTVTRTTGDNLHNDGPSAVKNYVDANIVINPPNPVNEVGHSETFTITVTALPAATGTPTFALPTVTFPGGAPGTFSPVTLLNINGNVATYSITINSPITGTFNVQASDNITMGGVTVTRTTGDNLHNDGPSAVKNYVDANIQITPPNPVNEVNNAETFTITVNALPAQTGTPSFATPTVLFPGLTPASVGPVTFVSINGNTATYTVTINNPTPGTFTVQASDVITMGGVAVSRTTGDNQHGDGPNAVKNYVDANIQITPPNPVNEVGHAETFTITVNANTAGAGNATFALPTVAFLGGVPGTVGPVTFVSQVGNTATYTVTINNPTPGIFTVQATDMISVGGVVLTRMTGDNLHNDGPNATKTYVDADIKINPPTASNEVNSPHTLTVSVEENDGTSWFAAPDGTVVTLTLTNTDGADATFTATGTATQVVTINNGLGTASVQINSSTAGMVTINATTTLVVKGVQLTRSTGDGLGSGMVGADPVGDINGDGVVNLTDLTILTSEWQQTGSNLPGDLNHDGKVDLSDLTILTSEWQQGSVGDPAPTGTHTDSGPAVKTYVDADIQINPPSATNPVGSPHTLTVSVEENNGNGSWLAAPDGTVVHLTLVNSNGASAVFTADGLTTLDVTINNGLGTATAIINSATAGDVTVNASTTLLIKGVTVTRTTGDGKGETGHFDSGPAVKHYISQQSGISGVVFADGKATTPLDGIQESGEMGIPGITMTLLTAGPDNTFGTSDDVTVATTTTDASGDYSFPVTPAGTYRIVEGAAPAGYIHITEIPGSTGGTIGDRFIQTTVPANTSSTGNNFTEFLPHDGNTGSGSITSDFNGTAIAFNPVGQDNYIWFNSIISVSGLSANTTSTILFVNQFIDFTVPGNPSAKNPNGGKVFHLAVPNARITFSPSITAAQSTTTFNVGLNEWEITVPSNGNPGNIFSAGLAFKVPVGGLPGGINPVTWSGNFIDNVPNLKVQWKWAAAVYNSFSADYNALGVKPIDSKTNQYANSDHAGTPENFTIPGILPGGARGGGGSNWTGSYSGTQSVVPTEPPIGSISSPATGTVPSNTSAELWMKSADGNGNESGFWNRILSEITD